jgi:Mrp family chromosome partitioning ATPase
MEKEINLAESIGVPLKTDKNKGTQIPAGASFAKHKIIVMSGKGGVGKSTVASNLAYMLSINNYKTGILDVDLTGPSIPKMLGIEKTEPEVEQDTKKLIPIKVNDNLVAMSLQYFIPEDKALIWRGSMRYKAIKNFLTGVKWGELDFLIIDMPPGTGDEPINIVQQIPDADGSVIVSTPQKVATQDVKKSILFSKRVNLPVLGVIENMSGFTCPHCHELIHIFGHSGAKTLADSMNVDFLGYIPLDPQIVIDGDNGKASVLQNDIREAFETIIQNLLDKLDN